MGERSYNQPEATGLFYDFDCFSLYMDGRLMGGEAESITKKCTWTEDHPGEDFTKPGDRLGILVDMRQGEHVLVQFFKNCT
jgi:hypothetical protein